MEKTQINYRKSTQPINFIQTCQEIDRLTVDVNHIVRVNGSSAFPMTRPKKKKNFLARLLNT